MPRNSPQAPLRSGPLNPPARSPRDSRSRRRSARRTPPQLAVTRAGSLCLAIALAAGSAHASDGLTPVGPPFLVNANINFNQYWPRVDISADGARLGFSYNSGQDPFARQFTSQGVPLSGDLLCNPTLRQYIQDEAETCFSVDGYQLVAWSERFGYDGEQMGIYGTIYGPSGAPVVSEFQINELWQASQWRPLISRRPGGGWVVAWSGDWDGDPLFRIVNTDGSFATGDVVISTWDNGAQVDTAPAIAPNGRMFMAFVDYSAFGGVGTGTNLWARLYDAAGAPLQPAPFPLLTGANAAGDQREPRVAADGLGRFFVTWEDAVREGQSWGIYALVYDNDATLLTPQPIHVNTTTAGAQRNPRVAADAAGNFVVCWEDWSSGVADIRAQCFGPDLAPRGAELLVDGSAGEQRRPSVAMHATNGQVVFTYDGVGVSTDTFARLYTSFLAPQAYCTAKVNGLGCTPAINWSGEPTASGPDDFHIGAANVLNNRNGLLFLGFSPSALPFYGGTLCVQPPVVRFGTQVASGSPQGNDCSGQYDSFLSQAWMATKGLNPGLRVYGQYWTRDPLSPQPVGLTNAVSFDVRP